ncbi:hypothetical protein [uncultured Sphingomonas sp.]|uniref:hypothetical protein n=1 Tax=uncultured Sphingomonas sp. TaxID=158754 RepID=UPI0025E0CCBF|nr:hypothetical protein [uncultured Sphingomonas sp.]
MQRRSTGTADLCVATEVLDRHYLAFHQPADDDKAYYTVHQAMTDYWTLHGAEQASADAIRARLKLVNRFIDHELKVGVLREPVLPKVLDAEWLKRFRHWGTEIDPVTQRRRDPATGGWTVSTRKRAKSTVEESIIQLKAALRFNVKRMEAVPELKHLPRATVTPERNFRLSLDQIAEMLDYTAEGDPELSPAHPARLMPLRRYLIGAICTLARPDALYDISVRPDRQQWHRNAGVLDLNPAGRIQTRKNRPALPVTSLLANWLEATDDRLVCHESVAEEDEDRWVVQRPVADVKKAWSVMARRFGVPIGFGPKLMRHSMATLIAQRGVSQQEIPLALGHVVLPPSTRRYVIFSPAYLIQTKQALEDIASELARKMSTPLHAKPTQVGPDGRRRRV